MSPRTTKVSFNESVVLRTFRKCRRNERELIWYSPDDFAGFKKDSREDARMICGLGEEVANSLSEVTSLGIEIQVNAEKRKLKVLRRTDVWDLVLDEQVRQESQREAKPEEIAYLCKGISELSAKDARESALKVQEEVKELDIENCDESSVCEENMQMKKPSSISCRIESPVCVMQSLDINELFHSSSSRPYVEAI